MSGSLFELWKSDASVLEGKTFCQIIQFAGEGRLRDGNDTSKEVRSLLAAVPLGKLADFANECLTSSFQDSGLALQDVTNQVAVRLGFRVSPGRYRGVKGESGFDGLWTAKDDHVLLVEVKTSDTYRINLDTIAGYRQQLIAEGKLTDDRSSILISVGRQDTGDLEAQIRGSRHAWDIRLISIDALLHLASVKEQMSDWVTSSRINQLLRPLEYTRVDQIVQLLFETSRDIETPEILVPPQGPTDAEVKPPTPPKPDVEDAREEALKRVSDKLGLPLVKKGRALRSSSDGSTNVVCLASQRHEGPAGSGNYWYGLTPAQRDFVKEAQNGWVVLACGDSGRAFAIERDILVGWLNDMLTTPAAPQDESEIRHWHIYFNDYGDRVDVLPAAGGDKRNIIEYLL